MNVVMKNAKTSKAPMSIASQASQPPIELQDGMWDRIARKAYELWDARGRRDGHALQDWLDSEAAVMDEIHEARE